MEEREKIEMVPHDVRLVFPCKQLMHDYYDMCQSTYESLKEKYILHNPDGFGEAWIDTALSDFAQCAIGIKDGRVQNTTWFAYDGPLLVGVVNFRHTMDADLKERGGNIGIVVDKRLQGNGYGQEMFQKAIDLAFALRINPYISIDKDNIPSIKAIAGVLARPQTWTFDVTNTRNGTVAIYKLRKINPYD